MLCFTILKANHYSLIFLITKTTGASFQQRALIPLLPDHRIAGGVETNIESNGWLVSVRNFGHHRCGGTIIRDYMIVTGAQCVDGTLPVFLTVRYGTIFIDADGDVINVSAFLAHPKYDPRSYDYDIALLYLEKYLTFSEKVYPAILPYQGYRIPTNYRVQISGWGSLTEGGPLQNQLHATYVPIVDDYLCDLALGINRDTMVCAGYYQEGGFDACTGDSGGSMILSTENGNILQGIISWGNGCGRPRYPGVYTRVAYFQNWIYSN